MWNVKGYSRNPDTHSTALRDVRLGAVEGIRFLFPLCIHAPA